MLVVHILMHRFLRSASKSALFYILGDESALITCPKLPSPLVVAHTPQQQFLAVILFCRAIKIGLRYKQKPELFFYTYVSSSGSENEAFTR